MNAEYAPIIVPFLDRHNDYIRIYVRRLSNGEYIVTDLGETVTDLRLCGLEETAILEALGRAATMYHVDYTKTTDEVFIRTTEEKLQGAKRDLVQSLLILAQL